MSRASILLFPLLNRTADIRHVAAKLLECASPRAVAQCQTRVAANLKAQAEWAGADLCELERQMPLFWAAVMTESARLLEARFCEGETA